MNEIKNIANISRARGITGVSKSLIGPAYFPLFGELDTGAGTAPNAGTEGGTVTIVNSDIENAVVDGYNSLALNYNGTSDNMIFTNTTDYSAIDFSISLIVKFDSVASNRQVISQKDGTGSGRTFIFINSGVWQSSIGGAGFSLTGISNAVVDTWYKVVITKTGTQLRFYVNSQTSTATKTMESANGDIVVGASRAITALTDGTIQGPKMYKRVLQNREIDSFINQ